MPWNPLFSFIVLGRDPFQTLLIKRLMSFRLRKYLQILIGNSFPSLSSVLCVWKSYSDTRQPGLVLQFFNLPSNLLCPCLFALLF